MDVQQDFAQDFTPIFCLLCCTSYCSGPCSIHRAIDVYCSFMYQIQEQIATTVLQRRVEELLLQVVSINKTMREVIPTIEVPPVPDISRLSLPAQISINITGCKTTTDSQEIIVYKYHSNSFVYLDEVTTVRGCIYMLLEYLHM